MNNAKLTKRSNRIYTYMFIGNRLHIGYDVWFMTKHQRIEPEDLETIRAFARLTDRTTIGFFSHLANRIRASMQNIDSDVKPLKQKYPYADVLVIKDMKALERLVGVYLE